MEINENKNKVNHNENHQIYKFKVRENIFETDKKEITGREICEAAGLIPAENFKLDMKLKGNQYRECKLDTIIDLSDPGIEKFTYITRDQTEG